MIQALIDFSIKNRPLVFLLTALLIAAGADALSRLPIDAVPDLTNTQVQILTQSPGLSPLEVETRITSPIEQAMAGLPKLKEIRSLSQFGLSVVTVVFVEDTDLDWARQQISQRLSLARQDISAELGTPSMAPMATGLGEIFQFEIRSPKRTPMELRTLLDWSIAPPLRAVRGVIEVNVLGGLFKTYEVQLQASSMRRYEVGVSEIYAALQASHRSAAGGTLQKSGEQIVIRGEGLLQTPEEIEAIAVKSFSKGETVRLGQIGKVREAPMIRQGMATRDGRGEVVTATVMMLMGANARLVSTAIRDRLNLLQKTLPNDIQIDVFYDRSILVSRTIRTVAINLFEGGLLVVIVLLLLLGNLRGGLLVALTIPLSMLFAVICMNWMRLSGNLMSLGAVDFGLIVDGAVVMVEHSILLVAARRVALSSSPSSFETVGVARGVSLDATSEETASLGATGIRETSLGLEAPPGLEAKSSHLALEEGASHEEVIRQACLEVGRPIAFSVGIIVLVYLPILTLQGSEGKLFRPMAWTLIFAMLGALLLSLTLIPALTVSLLPETTQDKETWLMRQAQRLYRPTLGWVLRFRRLTFGLAAGSFGLSLVLASRLGADFLPRLQEGMLALQIQRMASISLKESARQSGLMEALLLEFPEIRSVITKTGRPEIATDPMGLHQSDVYLALHEGSRWRLGMTQERLIEAMKARLLAELPGAAYSFSQPIEMRTAELLEGIRADIGIKIFGDRLEKLEESAHFIRKIVEGVSGAGDVSVEATAGLPYLRIRFRYDDLGRFGITAAAVQDAIEALGGKPSGLIFEGTRRIPLRLRFHPADRKGLAEIRSLPLQTSKGAMIRLEDVATLWIEDGPLQIQREQGRRRILVLVNVRGRDIASFVQEAQAKIEDGLRKKAFPWPAGYYIEWSGQFKHLTSAIQRLLVIVPLTLLLIFVLLLMAFGSLRVSLLVYLNIPIAITGGLVALFVRGMPFSVSAAIGFIALFGIAVMNGVVLLSAIRQNQERGLAKDDAIWIGATERLRPVLMTALTDAIGFFPMALSTSAGAEVQKPLATVVIGGIFTSMLLTLYVLPAAYATWGEKGPAEAGAP